MGEHSLHLFDEYFSLKNTLSHHIKELDEYIELELNKKDSYLPASPLKIHHHYGFESITENDKKPTKILPAQKTILLEEIKSIKEYVIKNNESTLKESLAHFVHKDMT